MTAALTVENIEVVYNHSVQALRGLSIEVPNGQIVALLGSNGAGKTTTLKAASGVLPYENGRLASGRITFFGEDISGRAAYRLARAGMAHVREGRHIFGDLTVEENLVAAGNALIGRGQRGDVDPELVFGYFPRLRERRKQLAGYLSGGEQQMLAIARGLMARPKLLLLDEPSLGLAPTVIEDLFASLDRLRAERMTILLVDQMAGLALSLADRAYVIEGGRISASGSAAQIAADGALEKAYLGAQ